MKSIVGAITKQERLTCISHLIVVVAQFMMHRREVFFVDLDTHLQAHIFFKVEVPGAGMTDDVMILWLNKKRSFPECARQFFKAQRGEKRFTVSDQLFP